VAHQALGYTLLYCGRLIEAREHLEQAVRQFTPSVQWLSAAADFGVSGNVMLAETLWFLGYPDKSLESMQKARERAQQINHTFSYAYIHNMTGRIYQLCGNVDATSKASDELSKLCTEHGFSAYQALDFVFKGWILVNNGEFDLGIAQIHKGYNDLEEMGHLRHQTQIHLFLADAYCKNGNFDKGLGLIAHAETRVKRNGERHLRPEIYRLKGELLLGQKAEDLKIRKSFNKAIEIARLQSAKSLELRSTISLSKYLVSQGQQVEARQALANIYGWFTEGFNTGDLREARRLLESLDT
jgi:adenylate cyclase